MEFLHLGEFLAERHLCSEVFVLRDLPPKLLIAAVHVNHVAFVEGLASSIPCRAPVSHWGYRLWAIPKDWLLPSTGSEAELRLNMGNAQQQKWM